MSKNIFEYTQDCEKCGHQVKRTNTTFSSSTTFVARYCRECGFKPEQDTIINLQR